MIFILFVACLWLLNSFNSPLWPRSHDGIYHAVRISEYYRELASGQFPVRWVDNLDYKYGLPLFNYVYPGPYLISSIPMSLGLGEITSYKLVMVFAYFIGALGYYFIYYKKNKFIALVSSLLFALSPYIFLDIFVRGAMGEVVAIGFMPWVIYGFTKQKHLLSILSLMMILISHSFLGILFLFFVLCKLIWERKFDLKSVRNILISLGLSSFFLLPLIIENKLITSGFTNNFTFDYRQHFLYPIQLLYGKWDYWYSNPGPIDGMSFQIGFANILIVLSSLFSFYFFNKKRNIVFLLLSVLFVFFLTLNYSQFVWEIFSPLQIVQFPWRLLFIPTIIFPLIYIDLADKFQNKHLRLVYFFSIGLIVLAFVNVRNYRRPMEYIGADKYSEMFVDENQKTTTSLRTEVTPRWSFIAKNNGARVINNKDGSEIEVKKSNLSLNFDINTDTDVVILKNYFPGWKLINVSTNEEVKILPDLSGNIVAHVLRGKYVYKYFQTSTEMWANYISIISLLCLVLLRFFKKL
ncbi:MAG: hypothetical protein WC069_01565 [Candidatus Shapirobacteria bacterium]